MLLTNRTKSAEARHSFRAGGSAYCRRDMSSAKLIQALRQALRGHYVLDEQVFDKEGLLTHLSPKTGAVKTGADSSPAPSLSHREMDVLQALTQGLSNKEVARVLGISQQTVKNHMTSLLGKCQAVDRTQLTVLALRQGLVHLQDIQPNRSRS
jgi:DNA-binding NarL/FixJ family response regulator